MIFTPKQYLWHGFGTLLLSYILCFAISLVGYNSSFMDPISKAIGSFSFIDSYFYIENSAIDNELETNQDILLFNIAGCNSRTELAGKLQQITDLKPRVIGMDVIYGDNATTGKEADDSLLHVVSRCPQLVTAMRITQHGDQIAEEHSFYTKLGTVDEACINVEDDVVRNFVRKLKINDIEKQSFVDRIIERAYPEAHANLVKRGNNEERINYKTLDFLQLGMADELFPEDVEDKIVLIGDFNDLRDFHNVPTTEQSASRIPGTRIHAYAISTFTKDRIIDKMGEGAGWIFGLILAYLFSILACVCFVEWDKLAGLTTNFFMVVMFILLSLAGGYFFISHNYELDMTVAMLGIGLAGCTSEIWFWLGTTRPYQWLQRKFHLPDGGVRVYVDSNGQRND
ncbi:MAG: CHASE2 domain-containing protein [Paludibacteraceae bacterium]|nr:CHASE2 domain-containing protein [Paludibacteraceae bacterium]